MAADDPVVNTVIIGVGDYRGGKGPNPSEGGLLGDKSHRIALLSEFLTYGLFQRLVRWQDRANRFPLVPAPRRPNLRGW